MNVFAGHATEIPGTLKTERIDVLKQHERTDKKHLDEVRKSIFNEGLNFPIIADKKTKLVLDGHHRLNALKGLGARNIPVLYVDYFDERIVLDSWRGQKLTKEEVLASAASGKLYPIKTTKHMFLSDNGLRHISSITMKMPIDIFRPNIKKDMVLYE